MFALTFFEQEAQGEHEVRPYENMRAGVTMNPVRHSRTKGFSMRSVNRLIRRVCLGLLLIIFVLPAARGEEQKPAGASAAATAKKPGSITGASVSDIEKIQFLQKNASAQLQELQERMYRLAELTREAEPDDAARLLMAVRKAREQLVIEQMKEVLDLLGKTELGKAVDEQKQVLVKLEELKKLLLSTNLDLQMQLERLKKLQAALAKLEGVIKEEQRQKGEAGKLAEQEKKGTPLDAKPLDGLKQDQERNRQATGAVSQMTKELGQAGAKAGEALGGASQSMSNAEGSLGGKKPGEAEKKQGEAVEALKKAKEELEREKQKLLEEIAKQVRGQVIENLKHMLERQEQIRKATEALVPKMAAAQRESTLRAKELARAEEHIVTVAEQTVQLIEETQFSIALPPAIRSIQSECVYVMADLNSAKVDAGVVASEKRIEKDITELLDTLKQSASMGNSGGQCKSCKGNKNKLLAELKIMRLLQNRVNTDTRDVDASRASVAELGAPIRDKIVGVRDSQAKVHEAMDKLHKSSCPDCIGGH